MTYQEFIKQHAAAVDYYHNVTVPFLSIENAEKACRLAQKELAEKLLEMNDMNHAADMLGRIRDEKI